MKEKMETELKTIREAREAYLKKISELNGQVMACNGAIQTLEKLLKEGEDNGQTV